MCSWRTIYLRIWPSCSRNFFSGWFRRCGAERDREAAAAASFLFFKGGCDSGTSSGALTCIPALIRNSCCAISTEIHIHIYQILKFFKREKKIQLFEFLALFTLVHWLQLVSRNRRPKMSTSDATFKSFQCQNLFGLSSSRPPQPRPSSSFVS